MFPLSAFAAETVSRLTNLSVRRLQRWDRTGFFTPTFADPNTRRPNGRVYSFSDVVGLRTIARLLEVGVPMGDLKAIRAMFGPDQENDWASRRFYVVGRRLYFSHRDAIQAARPIGEHVEPIVLDVGPVVAEVQESVRQLSAREEDQFGRITRDRAIMSGAPVIAGTRIPTATVAWFHHHGYSASEIIAEFPRLTKADISAAIVFERESRNNAQRDLLAAS